MDIIGSVVVSTAGRDAGRAFIVIGMPDAQHVLLVDGDLRKVEKPKLKKLKHIRLTQHKLPMIMAKIERGCNTVNAEIRTLLRELPLPLSLSRIIP